MPYALFKSAKEEMLLVKICYGTENCLCPEGSSEWRNIIISLKTPQLKEINEDVIRRDLFKRH